MVLCLKARESRSPPGQPDIRDHRSESREQWSGKNVQNAIDAFVRAKLSETGLSPSPLADKRTLLRRVTFDLIGLPPTPEEITAFLADESPQAYATRLLAQLR